MKQFFLLTKGFPALLDSLRKIYFDFDGAYDINQDEVETNISAFHSIIKVEVIIRLQEIKECHQKFILVTLQNYEEISSIHETCCEELESSITLVNPSFHISNDTI